MGKIGSMVNVVVVLALTGAASWAVPTAAAAEKSYLSATVDVRGNGALISGELKGPNNAPIPNEQVSFRIDNREACAQTTDSAGKATCDAKSLPQGKHSIRVFFAGNSSLGPSESVGEFEITPESGDSRTAQLKAQVSEPDVVSGGRATVIGTLATKKGSPIYGVRVSAASDGGAQATSLTDDNGGFQIPVAMPNTEQPTTVNVRVAFDGAGGQFSSAEQAVSVAVKPRSKEQPVAPQPAAASQPATAGAPASQASSATPVAKPVSKASDGAGFAQVWPMFLTGGIALALLGGLGYLAWRWHQRNNQSSEDDASLDDVAHFDRSDEANDEPTTHES